MTTLEQETAISSAALVARIRAKREELARLKSEPNYAPPPRVVRRNKAKKVAKRKRVRSPAFKATVAALASKRRAAKLNATPVWAELDQIRELYREAGKRTLATKSPWHVDHVIPLQGLNVCGLHVLANLQVIPGSDNIRKSNR